MPFLLNRCIIISPYIKLMISASSVIDTTQLLLNNVIELLLARRPAIVSTSVFFIVFCFAERAEFTTLF